MICRIYTETGELVMEAAGGVRRDGDFELIPVRAQRYRLTAATEEP